MTHTRRILPTDLLEHPATKAWCELGQGCSEPVRIEVLKEEPPERAVYRLHWGAMEYTTVIAKRCLHKRAQAEHIIYEEILPQLSLPVPHHFGYVKEPEGKFGWFFLQDVGEEKYRSYVQEHRVAAAQWLGVMHTSTASIAAKARLPEKGPEHYLEQLQSAHDTFQSAAADTDVNDKELSLLEAINSHCDYLRGHWGQFANIDQGIPSTVVHGDFIENNVRIQTSKNEIIILPFDWEKAGWGIPAEDISNVDIKAYWSTVRENWSNLSLKQVARLANIGRIYRCIVYLDWIAPRLANRSIEQPMNHLRNCDVWLTDLIQAAKWRETPSL